MSPRIGIRDSRSDGELEAVIRQLQRGSTITSRIAAAEKMAAIGGNEAVAALAAHLRDPYAAELSRHVAELLAGLGESGTRALVSLLDDSVARPYAVEALRSLDDPTAEQAVQEVDARARSLREQSAEEAAVGRLQSTAALVVVNYVLTGVFFRIGIAWGSVYLVVWLASFGWGWRNVVRGGRVQRGVVLAHVGILWTALIVVGAAIPVALGTSHYLVAAIVFIGVVFLGIGLAYWQRLLWRAIRRTALKRNGGRQDE